MPLENEKSALLRAHLPSDILHPDWLSNQDDVKFRSWLRESKRTITAKAEAPEWGTKKVTVLSFWMFLMVISSLLHSNMALCSSEEYTLCHQVLTSREVQPLPSSKILSWYWKVTEDDSLTVSLSIWFLPVDKTTKRLGDFPSSTYIHD